MAFKSYVDIQVCHRVIHIAKVDLAVRVVSSVICLLGYTSLR